MTEEGVDKRVSNLKIDDIDCVVKGLVAVNRSFVGNRLNRLILIIKLLVIIFLTVYVILLIAKLNGGLQKKF